MTTTTKKTTTNKQSIPELQPNPFQYEILELVHSQRSNSGKVEVLQKYRNDALVTLLIWNFDESVISLLPKGEVPYSRVDEQTSMNDNLSETIQKKGNMGRVEEFVSQRQTSIRKEYQNFYNYIGGGNPSLTSLRRETMFIQMLEGLHPKEAEIVILVKDKQLSSKYRITKEIVSQAYPDIQWGGRS